MAQGKAPWMILRLFTGFWILVKYIFSKRFATHVHAQARPAVDVAAVAKAAIPAGPKVDVQAERETGALQLLGILQQEGRLLDFIQDDVDAFEDSDVGAAARVVHDGLNKALAPLVKVQAVVTEPEGEAYEVQDGFDANRIRLIGNVTGQAPFAGTLVHAGWQADNLSLPTLADSSHAKVLAAAEVEL